MKKDMRTVVVMAASAIVIVFHYVMENGENN